MINALSNNKNTYQLYCKNSVSNSVCEHLLAALALLVRHSVRAACAGLSCSTLKYAYIIKGGGAFNTYYPDPAIRPRKLSTFKEFNESSINKGPVARLINGIIYSPTPAEIGA